jgi:hypothetical protein
MSSIFYISGVKQRLPFPRKPEHALDGAVTCGPRQRRIYSTVLAVLKFDEKTNEMCAVFAWKGSERYCNIQASPALQVETGFVHYVPGQRTLSAEEITATCMDYRKQHPILSRKVCRIPGWIWNSTCEEFLTLARTLPSVGLCQNEITDLFYRA